MQYYKRVLEKKYFYNDEESTIIKKMNIFELLAGTFATKLKIKKAYYYTRINYLNQILNHNKVLDKDSGKYSFF